jgi:hypothetical protein
MRPMEQAFALVGLTGFCGAKHTIETGLVKAASSDIEQIDAWQAIGSCVNRIFAQQTCH